jgi:hypothetical protein
VLTYFWLRKNGVYKVFRGKKMASMIFGMYFIILKISHYIIGRFGVEPLVKQDNFLFEYV